MKKQDKMKENLKKNNKATKPIKKKDDYYFKATCLFLTYPQNSLTRDEMIENINKFFKEEKKQVHNYVVTQEDHEAKDEDDYEELVGHSGKHFHVVIQLDNQFQTRNKYKLDIIGGGDGKGTKSEIFNEKTQTYPVIGHGNYQSVRNKQNVMRYICKSGDYVEHGINAKEFIKCGEKHKSTIIATKLKDKKTNLKELTREEPVRNNNVIKRDLYFITKKRLKSM